MGGKEKDEKRGEKEKKKNMGGDVTQNDDVQNGKRLWRVANIFDTKCMGGDLDETIDLQMIKSRELW